MNSVEEMRFRSDHDILFGIAFLGTPIALLVFTGPLLARTNSTSDVLGLILVFIVAVLFLWIWFGTSYTIKHDLLVYRCGPVRGTINIQSITVIEKGKTMWSGVKLALARKGLIIKYNTYDEIYISPKHADEFINRLTEINNRIKVPGNNTPPEGNSACAS